MKREDLKLLTQIVSDGHVVEQLWEKDPDGRSAAVDDLKSLILKCAHAETESLQRLSFHARNLSNEMKERHLGAILVPFERLLGRTLRDDEFITQQNDRPATPDIVHKRGELIVIADNLRSAFNVGAIFRTADCFGAKQVLLTGYTPTPGDDKTLKTSMGAQEAVPWAHAPEAKQEIARLKLEGYTIVALETAESAISIDDFKWPEHPALILGNERFGLDADTMSTADVLVKIPMHGIKNSLNVGIAFGIAAADWRRKLNQDNRLSPIGYFHASTQHPYEARRQGTLDQSGEIGVIELNPDADYEQALSSLDGFERIWLIYRFHHNTNWKPMVMPPRGKRTKRGVFATRSPYRPNPLGLTSTELVKIEGRKLYVRGFDLLDQTPIYDIKPYLPYADAFPNAKAGWLEQTGPPLQVTFTPEAEAKLNWLESAGLFHIKPFLIAQLEYDPLDDERKRVVRGEGDALHVLAYRTWRAAFSITVDAVKISDIYSGYSKEDLLETNDSYADKDLHRKFTEQI